MFVAADPTPKLVQFRETEAVRAIDDNRVDVRNVDPALNDGRAEQDVDRSFVECSHDRGQFTFLHLAMPDGNFCFRHEVFEAILDAPNRKYAVVQKIDLPLAI